LRYIALLLFGLFAACGSSSRRTQDSYAAQIIRPVVDSVRGASFPELANADIAIYSLESDYVYLEARFSVSSYFGRRLRYMIFFNPEAMRRGLPTDGLRAIVAHELAHINYYENQSRMGILSLVRLLVPASNARFERKADLDAIALGYAPGLRSYRLWLYRNIPADRVSDKKRDYYAPAEIDALLAAQKTRSGIMSTFMRCVPRNLSEIREEEHATGGACRP
jgi:hypothetical protein